MTFFFNMLQVRHKKIRPTQDAAPVQTEILRRRFSSFATVAVEYENSSPSHLIKFERFLTIKLIFNHHLLSIMLLLVLELFSIREKLREFFL